MSSERAAANPTDTKAAGQKAAVIYNPSSGRARGSKIAAAVEKQLALRGVECDLHATGYPREAITLAERYAPEVDIVIAIGGDGTINEIANGIAAARDKVGEAWHRPKLGVVPAGTVNVLALDLHIPFRIERACQVIAEGKTMALDLGKVNGHRFVLMMGAGIDALTVRNIDLQAKRRFKELAFLGTGVKEVLAQPPPVFVVRTNGIEYHATFFVAGNSRYYGGRFGVTTAADPTDGILDLVLFTGTSRAALGAFWLEVPSGLHLHNRNVLYLRSDRAEVFPLGDRGEPIWYQTDGELAGNLPATVEMDAHAIDILVP